MENQSYMSGHTANLSFHAHHLLPSMYSPVVGYDRSRIFQLVLGFSWVLAAIIVFYWQLKFEHRKKANRGEEPPLLPDWIPGIGNALALLINPAGVFSAATYVRSIFEHCKHITKHLEQ